MPERLACTTKMNAI